MDGDKGEFSFTQYLHTKYTLLNSQPNLLIYKGVVYV